MHSALCANQPLSNGCCLQACTGDVNGELSMKLMEDGCRAGRDFCAKYKLHEKSMRQVCIAVRWYPVVLLQNCILSYSIQCNCSPALLCAEWSA